jgi:hypothetical protein
MREQDLCPEQLAAVVYNIQGTAKFPTCIDLKVRGTPTVARRRLSADYVAAQNKAEAAMSTEDFINMSKLGLPER